MRLVRLCELIKEVIVSIHAPRVGCDTDATPEQAQQLRFNSRTPCGVRLKDNGRCPECYVSIHAPRVGCDTTVRSSQTEILQFQFTHPVWGATINFYLNRFSKRFNSRTPCGVRHLMTMQDQNTPTFQFTHPVWGATYLYTSIERFNTVSIHAPRVGCDVQGQDVSFIIYVSIHAPRVGCDHSHKQGQKRPNRFNSRTPCGVRHGVPLQYVAPTNRFNSRTPCGVRHYLDTLDYTQATVSIHAPRVGCDLDNQER